MASTFSVHDRQRNAKIATYFNNPREWSYRCEGAWTMVVSLTKMRVILRLKKRESDKKSPTVKEGDYHARETLKNLAFAKHVMSPLMGGNYVHVGEVISVPESFSSAVNENCRSHRPQHRLIKEVDESCSFGVIMPDFCFVPQVSTAEGNSRVKKQTGNPTVSVEIKPKCGFLPTSPHIDPRRAVKYSVCHYCMLQKSKVKEGKYKRQSKYCPLDLFSSDPGRVMFALESLVSDPQNNLRVFCNGEGIFTEELVEKAIQAGSSCCAENYFEVVLKTVDGFGDWKMAGHKSEDCVTKICHIHRDRVNLKDHKCWDGVTKECDNLKENVTMDDKKGDKDVTKQNVQSEDCVTTHSHGVSLKCHRCWDGMTKECDKLGESVTIEDQKCDNAVTKQTVESEDCVTTDSHGVNSKHHKCWDGVSKEFDKLGECVTMEDQKCDNAVIKLTVESEDCVTTDSHQCGCVGPFTKQFLGILLEILISDSKQRNFSPNQVSLSPAAQICKGSKYPECKLRIHGNLSHLQFGSGGVLKQLLSVQKLDDMDVEGIYQLYQKVMSHFECNPGVRDSLAVDGPYTSPLWKLVASSLGHTGSSSGVSNHDACASSEASNSLNSVVNLDLHDQNILLDAILRICRFTVAHTAKDSSVMVAFQKVSNKEARLPTVETVGGIVFSYNIDLVDLDPKGFDRVLKYYKDSKKAVNNFIEG